MGKSTFAQKKCPSKTVAWELHWQLLLSPAWNNLPSGTFEERARDWFRRLVRKNTVLSAGVNQEPPAGQLVWQVRRFAGRDCV